MRTNSAAAPVNKILMIDSVRRSSDSGDSLVFDFSWSQEFSDKRMTRADCPRHVFDLRANKKALARRAGRALVDGPQHGQLLIRTGCGRRDALVAADYRPLIRRHSETRAFASSFRRDIQVLPLLWRRNNEAACPVVLAGHCLWSSVPMNE